MSPELRIVNFILFALLFVLFAILVGSAVRARRRGTELGPRFVPSLLQGVALLLLFFSGALPKSAPDWLRYALLGASAVIIATYVVKVWQLVRRQRRDVSSSRS